MWDLVRPDLERRGHRVTTVDLPVGDPFAGAAAYARTIVEAVDWTEPPADEVDRDRCQTRETRLTRARCFDRQAEPILHESR